MELCLSKLKISIPESIYIVRTIFMDISTRKYDVVETSYHFYSDRIDLHFCDDPGGGRRDHPELAGGGAFQVLTFVNR